MAQSIFNRLGHPGHWAKAVEVSAGTAWFTGSDNYGAGAFLRGTGAIGTLHLSGGGSINIEDLDAGVIHELGAERVEGVASGSVYGLIRKGPAR